MSIPTLQTTRLTLRAFRVADAAAVKRLAGERDIAATTTSIVHPYEDGMAESWIATHEAGFAEGASATFAITMSSDGVLVGAVGLGLDREHERAELGYWIGKAFWARGYASEAARAVVEYGFATLGLHRIHASHFGGNEASARVLQKIGMRHEGSLRRHQKKWGEFYDLEKYGMLRSEWKGPR